MSEPNPLTIPSLEGVHILVVGDVMLDRYWHGSTERISPEAPVPVMNVSETRVRAGGAANVALNVVSLGARCTLVGLIGDDEAGVELITTLQAAGVQCDFLQVIDWPTIVKLRMVSQKQQLMRADFEQPLPDQGLSERLAWLQNRVEKHLQHAGALIIEDYDKGTITEPEAMIFAAKQCSVPVLVDPKMKAMTTYRGASVIKPNEKEFAHALQGRISTSLAEGAAQLCAELDVKAFVVTRGGEGLEVCHADEHHHVPARPVEVFDVTGAGDTTAATLSIGLSLGWSVLDAARLANIAASIAVSKLGTTPVAGPELHQALLSGAKDQGLVSREALTELVQQAQIQGQKVVFTNGCFDLLHAGHVAYLQEAAQLGDRLVVAINDDASVTRLKGPGRPVVPAEGRGLVLAGLGCVDWVVSFHEDTPEPLLDLLRPDILVKGGDYDDNGVVGAQQVRDYGGEVKVLSLVTDVSTSAIVDRIRSKQ